MVLDLKHVLDSGPLDLILVQACPNDSDSGLTQSKFRSIDIHNFELGLVNCTFKPLADFLGLNSRKHYQILLNYNRSVQVT